MAGLPNGTSPAADRRVAESTRREAAGLKSHPAEGPHGFCEAPRVPRCVRDVDKIEEGGCANTRDAGGQGALEQPFPRVQTLLRLSSGLIHSSDPGHSCDRGLSLTAFAAKFVRAVCVGSALVAVGHAYEDYRNHPLFTDRMARYFNALFGLDVRFRFPRLWYTKGQTLAAFAESAGAKAPVDAWSCWQQSRQVSVDGRKRQCGVCAACMLRRLSVHAAGLSEAKETYVWEDLGAATFELGAAKGFRKITRALREYAIAGTLHLDHLASLQRSGIHERSLRRAATLLARSQQLSADEAESKLNGLLAEHQREWQGFVRSLGPRSFVADWIAAAA
jgi:Queuosine biosynthesis protein QueC